MTEDRKRWMALYVLCLGMLMIVLDATIVNVALPSIQDDLGFAQSDLAWVVNAYLVAFGGLLLLAGRLGDLVGRRHVFLTGLAVFTTASLACALAQSQELLVGARFVQGIGGALTSAVILGMVVTMFPEPRDQAKAIGIYTFVAVAGGSIGLLVGGALTQAINWHWIFFVNLPIGVATALAALRFVEEHPGIGLRRGADLPGAVLLTGGLMLLVYAIVDAADQGWGSAQTIGLGAVSAVLLTGFVVRQARIDDPLVPLRLFRSPNVSGANAVQALIVVGMFGMFFLGALYMQRVLGYDALEVGLAFLPTTLVMGAMSFNVSAHLNMRYGPKATLIPSMVVILAGLVLFAQTPVDATYATDLLPSLALLGLGAGLAFPALMTLAMSGATPRDSGLASGLVNTSVQVGGALGLAVLATLATDRTDTLRSDGEAAATALNSGYHLAYLIGAGLVAVALVVAVRVLRAEPAPVAEEAPAVAEAPAPETPALRWDASVWGMLAVLCGVLFLDGLDVSMVGMALPSIDSDLGLTTSQLQWIVSGYVLGYGGFLLLGGRAADLLGRRRVLLIALAVFAFASALGGLVSDGTLLVVTRFLKGASAAFTAPAGLSIITTRFAEGPERNRALSIYTATGASGFSFGLVAGGLLTELGWRWTFLLPVPIAVVLLALAPRYLPRDRVQPQGRRSFDLPGAATLTAGMLLLVRTIVEAPDAGWGSAETVSGFAIAFALLAGFVAIERRSSAPLVRLGILRSAPLVRANLGMMALFGAYVGFQFVITLYLQATNGWSSVETALAFLPAGILVAVGSPRLGPIVDRYGPARVIVVGAASSLVGYLLALRLDMLPDYAGVLLPSVVLIGIGFMFLFPTFNIQATSGVADQEQGLASGLVQTSFQVGGAVGLAIVSAVVAAQAGSSTDPGTLLDAYRAAIGVAVAVAALGLVVAIVGLAGARIPPEVELVAESNEEPWLDRAA